ncbi:hypothetical protein DXG03_003711 [Asterophora parasitica]|uniref:Homoserine dehydrogenase n=1 Tax=Asterophora parasitica TaxID=117018 RepID=A0A9P7GAC6_9AGAR|nr:hypothetical protein DXG03_003711 [Asterophora parasitica]
MSASTNKIQVAIIGVGLVGAELVEQLLSIPQQSTPFSLISLSSSTRTIFDAKNPIAPGAQWKEQLAASTQRPDFQALTEQLGALVAPNQKVAVVDNTSSDDVAALYPALLEKGISVVTPNKKAYSGDIGLYERILAASKASGARFLNEATVGAGLPVISTLKELVATGDKVVKVEGVFSGTMSYIFNEFSTGKPDGPAFSSVVAVAREKGYTEPHPADDLNGFDVARKLTILSRTIASGSRAQTSLPALQSFKAVQTASLIPSALEGIPTGDEFISRLPEFDAEFAKLRADASAEGQVLRFVGVVDVAGGVVKAGLEKYVFAAIIEPIGGAHSLYSDLYRYSTSHPFATSLGGSDNIIMFHTERYGARPLIVQGAGAGAAVTAMGFVSLRSSSISSSARKAAVAEETVERWGVVEMVEIVATSREGGNVAAAGSAIEAIASIREVVEAGELVALGAMVKTAATVEMSMRRSTPIGVVEPGDITSRVDATVATVAIPNVEEVARAATKIMKGRTLIAVANLATGGPTASCVVVETTSMRMEETDMDAEDCATSVRATIAEIGLARVVAARGLVISVYLVATLSLKAME